VSSSLADVAKGRGGAESAGLLFKRFCLSVLRDLSLL